MIETIVLIICLSYIAVVLYAVKLAVDDYYKISIDELKQELLREIQKRIRENNHRM